MIKQMILVFITFAMTLFFCDPLWSQEIAVPGDSTEWLVDHIPHAESDPSLSIKHLLQSLRDIENLVINEFPGGAVISGELLNPADMRRIILLSNSMDNVINLCTFHPEALQTAATYIMKVLKQNMIYGLKLSIFGSALLLTGTPAEKGDISKVQRICNSLYIPLVDSTRTTVVDARMVHFEVSFVEVKKDIFRRFGVQWPASTQFSDPDGFRIGHLKPADSLEIAIEHQVYLGNARIITKPRLVCASGQKASFQAGGEIPIPHSDSEGRISFTWKPYGIMLEVAPSFDSAGHIHVHVRSEVSVVDHANAVEGVPGILTRKIETFLSVESGQTIVLSGLVHSDDAKNIQKLPLLADIPIFGELFKSQSFQKRETELVVFLTPTPISEDPNTEDQNLTKPTGGWDGISPGP